MSNPRFWSTVSRYCSELAPVVGPILGAASDLAGALDRAALPPSATAESPILPMSPEID